MSFKVLYIEDLERDINKIKKAATAFLSKNSFSKIQMFFARNPEEASKKLSERFDVIIADLHFPPDQTINRLDEIIEKVRSWEEKESLPRPTPLIAYTSRGEDALKFCLERKDHLYDIWDKSKAFPEYVIWRISQIEKELARIRPDTFMQHLIRDMDSDLSWHSDVVNMVNAYDEGWTEHDQIERAGRSIASIMHKFETWDICDPIWKVMQEWETLGRAVSRRTRGHARHVLNVFWMGYYILQVPSLRDFFESSWEKLKADRGDMPSVKEVTFLEAFANIWVYAALFHDCCKCIETYGVAEKKLEDIVSRFGDLTTAPAMTKECLAEAAKELSDDFWVKIGTLGKETLKPLWKTSLDNSKPDHGVVAAIYFPRAIEKKIKEMRTVADGKEVDTVKLEQQLCFAREAARAMAFHNLIGVVKKAGALSWQEEPVACLLLLCDQLQTWDRERGDKKLSDGDDPDRAELFSFSAAEEDGKTGLQIGINYIGPRHLELDNILRKRVAADLSYILKDKPTRALSKIIKPWPFKVHVDCFLSGRKLKDCPLDFG